ncbi:hypothetical protein GCM10027296_46260 [Chitinimonas naiadis]
MRLNLISLLLSAFVSGAACADATLIRDVAVFDGTAMLGKRSVLIRDGRIADADFKGPAPAGTIERRCDPCTLLPGLIDSHVHAFANQKLPVLLGVTTQLDMFMPPSATQETRARMAKGTLDDEADLFSAGILVTTPKGHGTEYGIPIPTLSKPEDADAFVAERLGEGSDYIKLVYDDGKNYGLNFTTLDLPTLSAAIAATHKRGKLAVVHVSTLQAATEAVQAGADGLVHLFVDKEADDAFVALAKQKRIFIVPTYTVYESVFGRAGSAELLKAPAIANLLDSGQRGALGQTMRPVNASARLDGLMRISIGRLKAAGIPILAGTDAGNPGTLHGASLHRELALLVQAGLSPSEALAAATSVPAAAFGLKDRGRIAKDMKADLLLVKGDPSRDILATRDIVEVWKNGKPVDGLRTARLVAMEQERLAAAQRKPQALPKDGQIGQFSLQDGQIKLAAPFGSWSQTADGVMQGKSSVAFSAGLGPEQQTSLRLQGELRTGFAYPWAGVAFMPGSQPFSPVDLSAAKGIRFKVRGDGGLYAIQAFWQAGGYQPSAATFRADPEWKELTYAWGCFAGFDPKTTTSLGIVAAMRQGPFQFEIADVKLIVD